MSSLQRSLTGGQHQLNGTPSYNTAHLCGSGFAVLYDKERFLPGGGESGLNVPAPEALQSHLCLPASPGFALAAELPRLSFTTIGNTLGALTQVQPWSGQGSRATGEASNLPEDTASIFAAFCCSNNAM